MSRELPAKPNLEHLKKQAKELLRDFQEHESAASERFRAYIANSTATNAKLSDAQHVIARDYGFASWPKLKEHVETLTLTPAEQLLGAVCASNALRVARVLEEHPELKAKLNQPLASYGDLPLLLAAVQRSDSKTINVLLGAGADVNARGKSWAAAASSTTALRIWPHSSSSAAPPSTYTRPRASACSNSWKNSWMPSRPSSTRAGKVGALRSISLPPSRLRTSCSITGQT